MFIASLVPVAAGLVVLVAALVLADETLVYVAFALAGVSVVVVAVGFVWQPGRLGPRSHAGSAVAVRERQRTDGLGKTPVPASSAQPNAMSVLGAIGHAPYEARYSPAEDSGGPVGMAADVGTLHPEGAGYYPPPVRAEPAEPEPEDTAEAADREEVEGEVGAEQPSPSAIEGAESSTPSAEGHTEADIGAFAWLDCDTAATLPEEEEESADAATGPEESEYYPRFAPEEPAEPDEAEAAEPEVGLVYEVEDEPDSAAAESDEDPPEVAGGAETAPFAAVEPDEEAEDSGPEPEEPVDAEAASEETEAEPSDEADER